MRARIVNQSRRAGRTPPRRGAGRQSASGRAASPSSGLLFHVPSFSIGLVLGAAVVLITGYLPELLAPPPEPAGSTAGAGAGAGAKEPTQQPLRFEFDTILRTPPTPVTTAQEPGTDPDTGLPSDGTAPGMAATDPAGSSSATATTESATPGVLDGQAPLATASMPLATDPGTRPTTPQGIGETPVSVVERPTGGDPAAAPTPPPAPAETAPASAASYMLQAASFRSRADADRLRAELLLLDLPATTGEVNVGGSVWYRVTVGPFPDQPSADVARDRLRERNLTAIPFRR